MAALQTIDGPAVALQRAVGAVGSQGAMARLLGVTQPSVWRWIKHRKPLPAEHVLAVEKATGISRHDLRPDLYPREAAPAPAPVAARATGTDGNRAGILQLGSPAR